MSNVRFTLRSPKQESETPIHLVYRLKGSKLVYPLKVKVIPNHWDKVRQRVRNVAAAKNKQSINSLLNDLDNEVTKFIDDCIIKSMRLSKDSIKQFLDDYFNPISEEEKSFFGFIDSLIEKESTRVNPTTGKLITSGTIRSLKGTKEALKKFELANYNLSFETITQEFYNDFVNWCNSKNYTLNNTGKHIKNLKKFMGEAVELDLTNNMAFRSKYFIVLKEDVDNIYLNMEELTKMFKLDLSESPKQDRARDLFLIGAFTGLRVSDFKQLTSDNIIKRVGANVMFQVETQKTGQKVIIPLHPIVSSILEKYDGKPPKSMPEQHINDEIKKIGKLAEIKDKIRVAKTKGGMKVSKMVPKHDLIVTHTARRSFCTNAYLAGVDKLDIMAISTHKTESSFMKYIKVTKQQHADRLAAHPFFKVNAI